MLSRRRILKLLAAGGSLGVIPSAFAEQVHHDKHPFLVLAETLLEDWCRGLLENQVSGSNDPMLDGGLYSAGDERVLGRCADAVYPFLWYAERTGDEQYKDAALKLIDWRERNVSNPDGSWRNGIKDKWVGITVFTAIAQGEALRHYATLLDSDVQAIWRDRLYAAGSWLQQNINIDYGNINYPASNAYALYLLGDLLEHNDFRVQGRALAHECLDWISEQNVLIFGEGRKNKRYPSNLSPKKCLPIDLAYNVEETLPALVQYAVMAGDKKVLSTMVESMRTHAEFMLPDGSWDNSWGTRNFKWTWWGSRTSDGCQPAYALLSAHDERFLEVAWRNTEMLKKCTYDGVLYAGPHARRVGVTPSLHHTFCHAKALTAVLNSSVTIADDTRSALPFDAGDKQRFFPEIDTWLVRRGPWRATVTAYDFPYKKWASTHPSGGTVSLLYHDRYGPLLVASMTRYQRIEKFDMQPEDGPGFGTLTPRIELTRPVSLFAQLLIALRGEPENPYPLANVHDVKAETSVRDDEGRVIVDVESELVDEQGNGAEDSPVRLASRYLFDERTVTVEIGADGLEDDDSLKFVLPIVVADDSEIERLATNVLKLKSGNARLLISSTADVSLAAEKIYSHVPGIQCRDISVNFTHRCVVTITEV